MVRSWKPAAKVSLGQTGTNVEPYHHSQPTSMNHKCRELQGNASFSAGCRGFTLKPKRMIWKSELKLKLIKCRNLIGNVLVLAWECLWCLDKLLCYSELVALGGGQTNTPGRLGISPPPIWNWFYLEILQEAIQMAGKDYNHLFKLLIIGDSS